MKEKEFIERGFYINQNGKILDNLLNENLEDLYLNEIDKRIKEIYEKQSKKIKDTIGGLK